MVCLTWGAEVQCGKNSGFAWGLEGNEAVEVDDGVRSRSVLGSMLQNQSRLWQGGFQQKRDMSQVDLHVRKMSLATVSWMDWREGKTRDKEISQEAVLVSLGQKGL